MEDLNKLLDIAKEAAILAGDFLANNLNSDLKILNNEGRDLKLQIDQDTEGLIKNYIKSRSDLPILAEESGFSEELGESFWVVDPLDGTSNFLRNIPISCVSIALIHQSIPVLGVINDFNNNHLYFAHQEMQVIISAIKEMASEVGKPTFEYVPKTLDKDLVNSVKDSYSDSISDAYQIQDKQERVQTLNQLKEKIVEDLVNEEEGSPKSSDLMDVFKKIEKTN